jgi:leader peptidase (prepilin peptidase) / N-methyltransferase
MSATLLTVYLVFVGLAFGSFLNLAADRLPRSESLVRPPSHCRTCGRRLNFVDLLPVAGYVIRGGRCATCRAPIGVSAPILECLCGACVATPILLQGLWPGAVTGLTLLLGLGSVVTVLALRRVRRA